MPLMVIVVKTGSLSMGIDVSLEEVHETMSLTPLLNIEALDLKYGLLFDAFLDQPCSL